MQILKSALDESVNFVREAVRGQIEARYVRRADDYFIGYLSSQTGCAHSCKFCHLTATEQKQLVNIDPIGLADQADLILNHYAKLKPARIVNWNFMARGEPLANSYITDYSYIAFKRIVEKAIGLDLIHRFNISTIMPVSLKKSLEECFPIIQPTLYYSIYSIDPEFRKKWMPAAMPVDTALSMLKSYQDVTGKEIKFHSPFIKGENDNYHSIRDMMMLIKAYGIRGSFNIVRYNPYSPDEGEETDLENLKAIENFISQFMPCRTVTRVGEDVKASCGMFVNS